MARHLLGIETNDTLIYRLTDAVGRQSGVWLEEDTQAAALASQDDVLYVGMDGSMILTCKEGWKEVKLGRTFVQSDGKPNLAGSCYATHLGNCEDFCYKFGELITDYEADERQLVFLCDGAKWQWKWIEENYPEATLILDFYHAMEHVGDCLKVLLNEKEATKRSRQLSEKLKQEGIEAVWQEIEILPTYGLDKREKAKAQLRGYIDNNKERMDYPRYIKDKLLIGSGAVESAHRTLIQSRMKLSGQRWSKAGAQRMLDLRTIRMNNKWHKVEKHLKAVA